MCLISYAYVKICMHTFIQIYILKNANTLLTDFFSHRFSPIVILLILINTLDLSGLPPYLFSM